MPPIKPPSCQYSSCEPLSLVYDQGRTIASVPAAVFEPGIPVPAHECWYCAKCQKWVLPNTPIDPNQPPEIPDAELQKRLLAFCHIKPNIDHN